VRFTYSLIQWRVSFEQRERGEEEKGLNRILEVLESQSPLHDPSLSSSGGVRLGRE